MVKPHYEEAEQEGPQQSLHAGRGHRQKLAEPRAAAFDSHTRNAGMALNVRDAAALGFRTTQKPKDVQTPRKPESPKP